MSWHRSLLACSLVASRAAAQNLLVNPSFEDPITFDGASFVGFWEGFSGGDAPVTASAANSLITPRTGTMSVDLTIGGSVNNFAGVFQDVAVSPGDPVTYTGWHRSPSSPLDVITEVRIEWKLADGNNNGSSGNIFPVASSGYTQFSLMSVAPANTAFARVVYAIQTFTDGASHTGTIYIDDFSATVPEPTALSLLGVGAVAVLRRRRALMPARIRLRYKPHKAHESPFVGFVVSAHEVVDPSAVLPEICTIYDSKCPVHVPVISCKIG